MNRAYSLLTIKAMDEDARIITGMASTPTPDRMDDIVEPEGAKFALPLPLLWQHNSHKPIGHVLDAKVTPNGIEIVARIAKGVTASIDEAWAMIKTGLVRGLSIGFRELESEPINAKDPWGGQRFKSWEWLELSAVTIPANAEASIHSLKSFDVGLPTPVNTDDRPAAPGQTSDGGDRTPGATGRPKSSNPERKTKMDAKTPLAEQIASFTNERNADQARLLSILAETAGSTLDEQQKQEYEELKAKLVEIDEHLIRLCEAERLSKAAARPVVETPPVFTPPSPVQRLTPRVEVRGNNLPKGTAFTRYAMALARAKGDLNIAASISREWRDTPEVETVLKAAVAAGTTTDATWAKPLVEYQAMASEFIELLRPMTIIGRIPGLRYVPFHIKIPRQTAGASAGWVGEGAPKPLSKLAFDTIQMDSYKAAVIVVITEELARFSNPSAEALVRTDLTAAIGLFLDNQFLDPAKAAVAGVSPASISNGATPVPPSGTSADALRVDLTTLMNTFVAANQSLAGAVWIMTPQDAVKISQMHNALGQPMFPSVTGPEGGSLMGIPVVTSTNIVPGATGSRIYLVNAPEVLIADDGIMLDISREASVQMDGAPDNPQLATTVMVSLWQHNLVGIRAERTINWLKRRAGAVQFIDNAAYILS